MSIITFSARETPLPSLPSANMIGIALSSDETKLIMVDYNRQFWYATNNGTTLSAYTSISVNPTITSAFTQCCLSADGNRGVVVTLAGLCYLFTWDETSASYSSLRQTLDTSGRWYRGVDMTPDGSRIGCIRNSILC